MPSERDLPAGQGGGQSTAPPGEQTAGGQPGSSGSADSDLDKALEDFDGGIMAERAVIQARSNETASNSTVPPELPGSSGQTTGTTTEGNPAFEPRGIPSENRTQKAPPMSGSTAQVPDDIPDARDDDIIARQLREAAMNETDPELREKLWEEYRRYKGA
jgi:hypothetical protein